MRGSNDALSHVASRNISVCLAAIDNTKEDPRELMPESEGANALKVCGPLWTSEEPQTAGPLNHSCLHSPTYTCISMHSSVDVCANCRSNKYTKRCKLSTPRRSLAVAIHRKARVKLFLVVVIMMFPLHHVQRIRISIFS